MVCHWYTQFKETGSMLKQKLQGNPWISQEDGGRVRVLCVENFLRWVRFTDKALFHINGHVNHHNYQIWGANAVILTAVGTQFYCRWESRVRVHMHELCREQTRTLWVAEHFTISPMITCLRLNETLNFETRSSFSMALYFSKIRHHASFQDHILNDDTSVLSSKLSWLPLILLQIGICKKKKKKKKKLLIA
jgi:hypothetical protein